MNSRIVIQKCSERLGYSTSLIEEVFMSYWKDKKEHFSSPEYKEIMIEYVGKFEMTDKRVATSLKYQEKELFKLERKIEKTGVEKGVKLTNIVNDIKTKIDLLNSLKQKYDF